MFRQIERGFDRLSRVAGLSYISRNDARTPEMDFDAFHARHAFGSGQVRAARFFRFDDTPTMHDTVAYDEVLPRQRPGLLAQLTVVWHL